MKVTVLFLGLVALLSGCAATATARKAPKADLAALRHLFVEHRLNDNHQLDELIVGELRGLGYEATSGPLTMMPPDTDAFVTYEDTWTFDFTTHMIAFTLNVTDNRKQQAMAEGSYSRPSVTHMAPAEMIHLTVLKVFRGS